MTKEEELKDFQERSENFRNAAFPVTTKFQYKSDPKCSYVAVAKGLSKEEWFIGMALNGICSNIRPDGRSNPWLEEDIARDAVRIGTAVAKLLGVE